MVLQLVVGGEEEYWYIVFFVQYFYDLLIVQVGQYYVEDYQVVVVFQCQVEIVGVVL